MIDKSFFVQKQEGVLSFQNNRNHGDRNQACMRLIKEADTRYKFADFNAVLVLTDGWCNQDKYLHICQQVGQSTLAILSFSADKKNWANSHLIPDDQLDQTSNYHNYCQSIEEAGKQAFQRNKICWIGQKFQQNKGGEQNKHPRERLIEMSKKQAEFIQAYTTNQNRGPKTPNKFLPITKQVSQSKYLLDIEGYGYSRELKFLLFSQRVLFIQDRPWKEWYHDQLEPYKHYIPVKRDLSDLINQYKWIEQHHEKYKEIAQNALQFAQHYLSKEMALEQLKEVFSQLSVSDVANNKPPLHKPSPYEGLPKSKFWRAAVTNTSSQHLSNLSKPKFPIHKHSKIVTAGSCFAQHITQQLKELDYAVLDAEPAPPSIKSSEIQKFGFGLFSARYGNIYTIRQFLQLYQEATELFQPANVIWGKAGKFYDALRPGVEPFGLDTKDSIKLERKQHLQKVVEIFHKADVVIFTLGLTEAWEDIASGTIYPMAPGTVAGQFNPEITRFKNFNYQEIVADFQTFRKLIKTNNPNVQFLLTVSPVHLVATASEQHVLPASTYSKSILRAAAGYLVHTLADVDYFPSYEIITNPASNGRFYKSNYREVNQEGINCVMQHFLEVYGAPSSTLVGNPNHLITKQHLSTQDRKKEETPNELCDLALLEAFEPKIEAVNVTIATDPQTRVKKVALTNYLQQLSKAPIIIGGCARSGTTLLLSILSAHAEVLALKKETYAFAPSSRRNDFLSQQFEMEKLHHELLQHPLKPQHSRWAEKTPRNIYFFKSLLNQFEEVKLIQIVRDGRDVIVSKHPARPQQYWVNPKRWIEDVETGLDFLYHPRVFTVRFEDLINNYIPTIKLLCDFLELPFNKNMSNWYEHATMRESGAWFGQRLKKMSDASIGRWKEKAHSDRINKFMQNERAVRLLKKFEYLT